MNDPWLELLFWVGLALLIVITVLVIWHRLYKEFPILLGYFLASILGTILRRTIFVIFSMHSMQYFYSYWLSESVLVIFAFGVLYEVSSRVFFPSSHSQSYYRYFLLMTIALGGLMAVFVFVHAPRQAPNLLSVIVGQATLVLSFLQVTLLLLFFVIAAVMGRGWEWHESGIALGYGLYAISMLVTTAVRAKAGYARTPVDNLPIIGYLAALTVWLVYLSRSYKTPDINIPTDFVDKALSWKS